MAPEEPRARARENPRPPGEHLDAEGLRLHPRYTTRRNEILRPDETVVATRYFWDKWLPRLGPDLTCLVVRLRIHCQEQRKRQELAGGGEEWVSFYPSQEDLGQELGLSRKTVMRLLDVPEARCFIRRERRYVKDQVTGAPHRAPDAYFVRLDDPLTPEDDAVLLVEAAERIAEDALRGIGSYESQSGTDRGQSYESPDGTHRGTAYRSQEGTHRAVGAKSYPPSAFQASLLVPNWDSNVNVNVIEENVNVGGEPRPEEIRAQSLADRLVEELGDPKSRPFFLQLARRYPEPLLSAALAETKDAYHRRQIRKSRGAYFTDLVFRRARQMGVDL